MNTTHKSIVSKYRFTIMLSRNLDLGTLFSTMELNEYVPFVYLNGRTKIYSPFLSNKINIKWVNALDNITKENRQDKLFFKYRYQFNKCIECIVTTTNIVFSLDSNPISFLNQVVFANYPIPYDESKSVKKEELEYAVFIQALEKFNFNIYHDMILHFYRDIISINDSTFQSPGSKIYDYKATIKIDNKSFKVEIKTKGFKIKFLQQVTEDVKSKIIQTFKSSLDTYEKKKKDIIQKYTNVFHGLDNESVEKTGLRCLQELDNKTTIQKTKKTGKANAYHRKITENVKKIIESILNIPSPSISSTDYGNTLIGCLFLVKDNCNVEKVRSSGRFKDFVKNLRDHILDEENKHKYFALCKQESPLQSMTLWKYYVTKYFTQEITHFDLNKFTSLISHLFSVNIIVFTYNNKSHKRDLIQNHLYPKTLILYTDINNNYFVIKKKLFDTKVLSDFFTSNYVTHLDLNVDINHFKYQEIRDGLTTGLFVSVRNKLFYLELEHPIAPLCLPEIPDTIDSNEQSKVESKDVIQIENIDGMQKSSDSPQKIVFVYKGRIKLSLFPGRKYRSSIDAYQKLKLQSIFLKEYTLWLYSRKCYKKYREVLTTPDTKIIENMFIMKEDRDYRLLKKQQNIEKRVYDIIQKYCKKVFPKQNNCNEYKDIKTARDAMTSKLNYAKHLKPQRIQEIEDSLSEFESNVTEHEVKLINLKKRIQLTYNFNPKPNTLDENFYLHKEEKGLKVVAPTNYIKECLEYWIHYNLKRDFKKVETYHTKTHLVDIPYNQNKCKMSKVFETTDDVIKIVILSSHK